MEVFINVTDINECFPLTEYPSYRIEIPENTNASINLLRIKAFDCDPGVSGLRFAMKTSTPYFEIDPLTGEIVTTEMILDREKQALYVFDITVTDTGSPSLNSSTQVVVKLLDLNDNSPRFLHKRGIHNIPELAPDLQGDQPGQRSSSLASGINNEESSSEEMEEEEEEEEEDEEAHKWSDWNVMDEHPRENEMFSEGGGWKRIFQVVAYDGDEGGNGTVRYR